MPTVDDNTPEQAYQLARRGGRPEQARLLEAMQDHWFRFCLAQLRDTHRAEDATQETAVRVLQSLERTDGSGFDGRSSFKTWSFGVALNVCRELRRKHARQGGASRLDDVDEPERPASTDDAAPRLESAEDHDALRALLAELPQRQREVVTLRYLEAMSVEETAGVMGCAQGTVKATLFAALRTLRERLSRRGV